MIATARNPSSPLVDLTGPGKLHVLQLDIADKESIKACGEEVKVSVLGLALFGTALYERVQMHYRF